MQRNFLLFLACSLLFWNCKNDDSLPEPEAPVNTYTQLAIGNYWVYQWHNVNLETSQVTPFTTIDSIYIAKDTLIGEETYYIMEGTRFNTDFRRVVRNDGNELIDEKGNTLLSTQNVPVTVNRNYNFEPNFIDSVVTVLNQSMRTVETPNGMFTSDFQYEKTFYVKPENIQHNITERFETDFYVEGIGVAQYSTFWMSSPNDVQARLLRYHVN